MNSPDHPDLAFVQAEGYTRGRPDGPPLWIVIHDMEAGESSDRAERTAAYFANPSDGRSVSSHYCADDTSVVQCVLLKDSAWTVGNRPGNNRGVNWELAGYARQSREEWLDPFGLAMFARMAPYVRSDAARFGIPLARRTVAELKAFQPGVTSHNDLRLAFGGTTHTDPGPAFPWDVFLSTITGEAGMTPDELLRYDPNDPEKGLRNRPFRADAATNSTVQVRFAIESAWDEAHAANVAAAAALAGVEELKARPSVVPAPVDPAELKAGLTDPEVLAAIATAVADEHHRRSAE